MTDSLVYWFDLIGVAVFALSGVIEAGRARMDTFGVIVLAIVTAIGGGTLRDLILGDAPIFWVTDPLYIMVAIGAALIAVILYRYHRIDGGWLIIADAAGLALFTILGARKSMEMGYGGFIAVVMGTMTGVMGGVLRDVLARHVPLVFRKELYATASIAGGIAYTIAHALGFQGALPIIIAMLATFMLRMGAVKYKLSLPVFKLK